MIYMISIDVSTYNKTELTKSELTDHGDASTVDAIGGCVLQEVRCGLEAVVKWGGVGMFWRQAVTEGNYTSEK